MPPSRAAIFLLVVASLVVAALSYDEYEQPVTFSYGNASSTGPEKWGGLHPDYKLCSDGKSQSPINIVKHDCALNGKLPHLDRNYTATNATLVNSGREITLKFDQGKAGAILVDGKNYTLKMLHWHSPSEHTINGDRYPMELHFVHKSDDGDYAVVAILYKLGKPEPFFFQLKNKLTEMAGEKCDEDEESHIAVGKLHMKSLMKRTRKYYRYSGSLTHPPCTENVIWSILGKVREMSEEQAALLMSPLAAQYRTCARPTQPLNGRAVQLYDDSKN